jgi:hypothetical protein
LVVPDDESRTKQYREIAQMVGESPVIVRSDAATANPSPLSSRQRAGAWPDEGSAVDRSDSAAAQHNVTRAASVAPTSSPANFGDAEGNQNRRQDAGATTSGVPGAPAIELVLPSIMPDEFADNHAVELEICMRWFSSDAGQVAKIESPSGYANVRAHAMFHREFLLKQQRVATQAQHGTAAAPPRPAER